MKGGSLEDAFKAGVAIAASLFLYVYVILLQNAESTDQAIRVFGRTLYAFVMAFYPTSELALFLNFLTTTVGATIAARKLPAKGIGIIIVIGFLWTATNIIVSWFTAPI